MRPEIRSGFLGKANGKAKNVDCYAEFYRVQNLLCFSSGVTQQAVAAMCEHGPLTGQGLVSVRNIRAIRLGRGSYKETRS